jgi:LSD1 subclass zinc finger protein
MSPIIRDAAQWREVRHRIDLDLVAHELLGEPEERSGDTSCWRCPLCGGTRPCLQVTRGKSRWKCAKCNEYGDAVDLVRSVRQVTFSKALEFLSRREFYPDEEETRAESVVFDGSTRGAAPDESDDDWIDNLLRDD